MMMYSGALFMYVTNVHVSVFAIAVSAMLYFWPKQNVFLTRQRKKVRIVDIKKVSHDTKRFRLSLGDNTKVLGCPVGKHIVIFSPNPKSSLIYLQGKWNGQPDPDEGRPEIFRMYSPVSCSHALGYFDILVVKIYQPGCSKMADGSEVTWHDGGKGGLFLDSKKVGDEIEIAGPVGCHEYFGRGFFKAVGKNVAAKHVGLIAGGVGITSLLPVIQAALRDCEDTTTFNLLYANKTAEDILFREALDQMAEDSYGRFTVQYTLDFPTDDWQGKRGFVSQDMLQEAMPAPSKDTLILMSGPLPMIEECCKTHLSALGYDEKTLLAL